MRITASQLYNFDAPKGLIDYIKEVYPAGAEVADLMKDPNIEFDYLHFARNYLPLTKEEVAEYMRACEIDEESKDIYNSEQITSSKLVAGSTNITDSCNIFNSQDVIDSRYVANSMIIQGSANILNSYNVAHSNVIVDSKRVMESSNILSSEDISWCDTINFSTRLEESRFIYKSDRLNDSYFCGFCKGANHLLFCVGVEGADYMIFNQPVSIQDFEIWREKLLFMLSSENSQFIPLDVDAPLPTERFKVNYRLDAIFRGLSSNFYGQVGNFPNFSDDLFIDLFFRDREI